MSYDPVLLAKHLIQSRPAKAGDPIEALASSFALVDVKGEQRHRIAKALSEGRTVSITLQGVLLDYQGVGDDDGESIEFACQIEEGSIKL